MKRIVVVVGLFTAVFVAAYGGSKPLTGPKRPYASSITRGL